MKNVIENCSKIRYFASIGLKSMVQMIGSEEKERVEEPREYKVPRGMGEGKRERQKREEDTSTAW